MERLEGIVLSVVPYKERQQIVQLLTKERGKLSLLVSGKRAYKVYTEPFSCSEWTVKEGRRNLCLCQDVSLVETYAHLRVSYPAMTAGGLMLKLLLKTQFPDRPCQTLYESLRLYLGALPAMTAPLLGALSFGYKLLRHEGILEEAPPLPKEAIKVLHILLEARNFQAFESIEAKAETLITLKQYLQSAASH